MKSSCSIFFSNFSVESVFDWSQICKTFYWYELNKSLFISTQALQQGNHGLILHLLLNSPLCKGHPADQNRQAKFPKIKIKDQNMLDWKILIGRSLLLLFIWIVKNFVSNFRSTGQTREVTVNNVTICITEYKAKINSRDNHRHDSSDFSESNDSRSWNCDVRDAFKSVNITSTLSHAHCVTKHASI